MDRDIARAIDGHGGGAYAPSSVIEIGGEGLEVSSTLDVTGTLENSRLDALSIHNWNSVFTVTDCERALLWVPAGSQWGGSPVWHTYGTDSGNPVGMVLIDGIGSHDSMDLGAGDGLTPTCAASNEDGSVILVGGTPGSGSTKKIRRSTDRGETWTIEDTVASGTTEVSSLAYVPLLSLWVAGLSNGNIETSPDGETWTNQTVPNSDRRHSLAVSDDEILAFTNASTDKALRSTNGTAWSEVTMPASGTWAHGAWNAARGKFMACDTTADTFATSATGATWTPAAGTLTAATIVRGIAAFNKAWLIITGSGGSGGQAGLLYSADDGASWRVAHNHVADGVREGALGVGNRQIMFKDQSAGHYVSFRSAL
jgi:hypothetical protein